MNECLNNEPNYITYYNSIQMCLPLGLGYEITPTDELLSFLEAIKGVDLSKYMVRKETRGRKGHNRIDLLRAELFAYMKLGHPTLREFEYQCRRNLDFMFLTKELCPSSKAFERLEKSYLKASIEDIFYDISAHIGSLMGARTDIQYIDGTKIEAYANKYSFVYRNRILTNRLSMCLKITESVRNLNIRYGYSYPEAELYCAQEIGYITQYLLEQILSTETELVYGKGHRKAQIQRDYETFLAYYARLVEYEYWLDVIGDNRKSCTKTDHDATMSALKIDYYNNSGIKTPAYNVQIGVSDGVIMNAGVFQNPGDTTTFTDFMDRHYAHYGEYPLYPMADAGYGGLRNYLFCLMKGMNPVMKYNMYAKKNESKYKKNIYNPANWEIDENGHKICPHGNVFSEFIRDVYEEKNGTLSIRQLYRNPERCAGCPFRNECLATKKKPEVSDDAEKICSRNEVLEQFHEYVDITLGSEFGKELKKQRSIQVEGAFGVIKEDMRFTRFRRRGMKGVTMEFLLVCLGYNLKKYHMYRLRQEKKNALKA